MGFYMKIIKVPYIDQTVEWPTGCESVSAVMLLNYIGINISVDEFVDKCLVKEPMINKDGKLYGPDPRKRFAGDPKDPDSFGAYAPVIMDALNKAFKIYCNGSLDNDKLTINNVKPNTVNNYEAVDLTNAPMETIISDYIDNNKPVIFWASIDLKETIKGPSWTLSDTGEEFEWISNEHCMLLVGYDEDKYYFNDPWHNHGTIGYEKTLVEKRHEEQMSMAVSY